MRTHEITERAQQLAAIPATERRPRCDGFCRLLLVDRNETRGVRVWRCEVCLRYLEAPISGAHERASSTTAREPLPDQVTLYNLLAEADEPPAETSR